MKKLTILAASCSAVIALTAPASAQSQSWYGSAFLGASSADNLEFIDLLDRDVDISLDSGLTFGFASGRRISPQFRLEGEASFERSDLESVIRDGAPVALGTFFDTKKTSYYLLNAWYDVPTGGNFNPYVGGGIGAGVVKLENDLSETDSDLSFAYQIGLGVTVPLGRSTLDVGYRYKAMPSADLGGVETDVASSTLQVGLLFGF